MKINAMNQSPKGIEPEDEKVLRFPRVRSTDTGSTSGYLVDSEVKPPAPYCRSIVSTKQRKMAELPLADRVDEHFRTNRLALQDVNGMMRLILDSLGALRYRLQEEETVSHAMINVFGNAVRTIIDDITGYEHIDNESAMKYLFESFPDENKRRDGRNWLPLHWAAAIHNTTTEDIQTIIKERPLAAVKGHMHFMETRTEDQVSDVMPEESAYRGLLPIHLICSLKYPIIPSVQALVRASTKSLMYPDNRGFLPMHWCAYNCAVPDCMKLLIRANPDPCFSVNKKGKLPFQLCAYNRCVDMVDLLYVENPESVHGLDYNGNSPMHDAAKSFNYEVIPKLWAHNNELCRVRNFREQLPIHKAFSYIPNGSTRLIFRHLETIKALLKCNPETASLQDSNDSLPLHLAVFYNSSIDVVREIYNVYPSGALVRDSQGKLPIQYVSNAEVKKLLMKASPPLMKAGLTDSFARFVT